MMARFILYYLTVIAAIAALGSAKKFLESDVATKEEVEATLAFELAGGAAEGRVKAHEEALRVTYASLPKNADGNLGHQAVRYVLHRFFVQRNGWYIVGLEPTNDTWHTDSTSEGLVGSVPSFVQSRLEEQLGERGVNLHELAALAVVIEDLIRKEAVTQIQDVYKVLGLSTEGNISAKSAQEAVDTYLMIYLVARKVSLSSKTEAAQKRERFASKYKDFSSVDSWMHKVEQYHFDAKRAETDFSFSEVSKMVEEIGEQFGTFNDQECKELKTTLMGMESRKAGRVRLPEFYNRSLYSHWRFTEKADYLRVLGALDDSDPAQPYVIVPNYLAARPNCLEATNLYAVCCRNECEDLLGHLEREIGASTATPERIVNLVSNLKSDTVSAPRVLPPALPNRLEEVAALHGGEVNLHGRLFAQWMHHAYPRECPYPHEAGTTAPQTADEWMKASGHESEQASEEEMKKVVEDACRADEQAGSAADQAPEQDELPWSHKEELLLSTSLTKPKKAGRPVLKFFFLVCLAVGLAALWLQVNNTQKMSEQQSKKIGMFLALCWFTVMLVVTGVLDMLAFVCPVIGGILMFGVGQQAPSMPGMKKSEKSVV